MDYKEVYAEARRCLKEAREKLTEFEGQEMPAEVAEQVDKLMEQADQLKARADRLKAISEADADLEQKQQAITVGGGGAGATFDGFELSEDNLTPSQARMAHVLGRPEVVFGQPANPAQVKAMASQLYPVEAYGGLSYDQLRARHLKALAKYLRFGMVALDTVERKLMTGRLLLTPGQIGIAIRAGMGPAELKDLSEGVDTAGGFLVPEDFRAEVIRGLPGITVVRPRARVIQTSRDVLVAPKVTGSGNSYSSAVRLTWVAETPSATAAETDPTFGQERIPVHTAMATTQLSNNLIEDTAVDLLGLMVDLYREAFALGEDDAFLQGDSVGKPKGIFESASQGNITAVNSGNGSALTADGLISLVYNLPLQYRRNASHIMARGTIEDIRQFKDGNGQYMWQMGLAAGQPDTLLGYPVAETEFAPAVASDAYVIAFGDLKHYWIADRVGMTVQRLVEMYAEQNMTGFCARKRVGGQLVLTDAFRVQKVSA